LRTRAIPERLTGVFKSTFTLPLPLPTLPVYEYDDAVCNTEEGETEDEDEGIGDEEDDDDDETTGARPRRISELKIPNKVKPIPLSSSLFVFSTTNRFVISRKMTAHNIVY